MVLNGIDSATNVDVYGTLSGTGSIDPTTMTIHSGGTFAPGTGTRHVDGDHRQSRLPVGALYQIYLNSAASTYASVTGTATLAGTVNALRFRKLRQQAIHHPHRRLDQRHVRIADHSNLPSNFHDSLSYDGTMLILI